MKIEIIRQNGDLKREVWEFALHVDYSNRASIYLQFYAFQTKETARHRKWVSQTHWQRYDKRQNNIDFPPIPLDVDKEVHERYKQFIDTVNIEH